MPLISHQELSACRQRRVLAPCGRRKRRNPVPGELLQPGSSGQPGSGRWDLERVHGGQRAESVDRLIPDIALMSSNMPKMQRTWWCVERKYAKHIRKSPEINERLETLGVVKDRQTVRKEGSGAAPILEGPGKSRSQSSSFSKKTGLRGTR